MGRQQSGLPVKPNVKLNAKFEFLARLLDRRSLELSYAANDLELPDRRRPRELPGRLGAMDLLHQLRHLDFSLRPILQLPHNMESH
jgi:hypothetical protein